VVLAAASGAPAQPDAPEPFEKRAASAKVLIFRPSEDLRRPAALVVALHGLGGTAEGFAPVWQTVADRAGVVLAVPEAVERFEAGTSWGKVEDCETLVLRAIAKARSQVPIDPRRIVLTGFSQGATMTYHVALRHPDVFAGAIALAGRFDESVTSVPSKAKVLPRFAILCGERDRCPENNRAAARTLEAAGAQVLLKIYPGLGHELPPRSPMELYEALRFVLGVM